MLADVFLERCTKRMQKEVDGFGADALDVLTHYDWPGNVRELENVIERGVAIDLDGRFGLEDLPSELREAAAAALSPSEVYAWDAELCSLPLADFGDRCEKRYLSHLLRRHRGSIKATACDSGVNEKTLYLKMKRHGLRKEQFK